MNWFKIGLSEAEKDRFEEFQKNRRPSMRVIGRGTLTMSLEDARAARREMLEKEAQENETKKVADRNYQPAR
ncbi:hypothetical protein [Acinetobacter gyllenbergii]|uniref:hypothetical protein n=1 Tax=Acinetobacter gyllenbergii TaxID=134534 RepID=UPI000806E2B5|nr:hypothetical protein [Acinetobacter gyllenbergii]OBY72898.1 hypothetical protein NG55_17560 [Acinetobacter gyllenbergii]